MASTINASTSPAAIIQTADGTAILALQTGNTTAVTIDASQNVGIGTSSPDAKLSLKSPSVSGTQTILTGVAATSSTDLFALTVNQTTDVTTIGTPSGYAAPFAIQTNGTEQARITTAGLLQFNSGYGSVETAYGCRAWVNFNGTGTVAIRGSGNVTSITDNGTGDYTVNFTTAMPDTNYCGVALPNDGTPGTNLVIGCENQSRTKSTSAFHVWTAYGGNGSNKTLYDINTVNVAIFR